MNEVEFLEYIVKSLVSNKDAVSIERVEDDMWTIIWKSGNTINSIRNIIRIFWIQLNKKINIKVLD